MRIELVNYYGARLYRAFPKWKTIHFFEATGVMPEDDDLDRVNCPKAGLAGHMSCGICEHNLPSFHYCEKCANKMGVRDL